VVVEKPSVPTVPGNVPEKIDVAGMLRLREAGEPLVILDVRAARSYETSGQVASGTVRLDPDRAVQEAERLHLPREAWLVAFCA
jgi:hypothetical protein